MKLQEIVTRVQGKPILVQDVVDLLKINGNFRNTIYQLIEQEVVAIHAKARGITYSDEELEEFNETKRRVMGLSSAISLNNYCRMNGIRQEQWKAAVASELLKCKLKSAVVGNKEVDAYFHANRESLKMACLSRIVVKTKTEAEEIMAKIKQEDADFATLARQCSLEQTSRIAGGYLGCFKRGSLPPEIDSVIFASPVKSVAGPFAQNGIWSLYYIEEMMQAEINESLRGQISDRLFNKWLSSEVQNARSQ